MNKSQSKNLWKNDCFAGCVMAVVFTCIVALLGIGGGQIWSNTKCGRTGIHREKVMKNALKSKTSTQLLKAIQDK